MAALKIVNFLERPKKATIKVYVIQQKSEDEYLVADDSQLANLIAMEGFKKGRKHLNTLSYLRVILPALTSRDNTIYLDDDSTLVPCGPFSTVPVEHGEGTAAKLKSGSLDTPLETVRGFSPGDVVGSILVKIVKMSEAKKVGRSSVARATIKDISGSKTCLSLWNEKAKVVKEGSVYRIKHTKVDNFPPNESPKHLSTTFRSTFKEEEGSDFEAISIVDERREGVCVGVSDFFFYASCPHCFKKLHDDIKKCQHCGNDVDIAREDFKCEVNLQEGEEIHQFIAFKRVLDEVVSESNDLAEDMATTERRINEYLEDQHLSLEVLNQGNSKKIVHSVLILPTGDANFSASQDDYMME